MKNLNNILKFGLPFLRVYWRRFVLGIALGALFGFSHAFVLGGVNVLLNRLDPKECPVVEEVEEESRTERFAAAIGVDLEKWGETFDETIDVWLPMAGRELEARQIAGLLLMLPMLVALRGFLGYASSYCLGWVGTRVINDMRVRVLEKMNLLSLDFFNRSQSGDLMTRINGDTIMLHRALTLGLSDIVKEPVTIIGVLGYLLFKDWKLTLMFLTVVPVIILPLTLLGSKVRRAAQGKVNAGVLQSNLLIEMLAGIRVVKAFCMERIRIQRFKDLSGKIIHNEMKAIQAQQLINPILETIIALALAFFLVYVFRTGRTPTEIFVFLGGLILVFDPIKKLSRLHMLFSQASVGVDRLKEIFEQDATVVEPLQTKEIETSAGDVTFEGVGFGYGETQVLFDVNLKVKAGEKIGIAGESGSGKSTMLNLLFRFFDPTRGAVTLGGVNLKQLPTTDLRGHMALVSQEIVLFDMTVAENIACGKPGASREEIIAAAHAAHAHEFIDRLPDGYDTRIGEQGVTLSGGQRQRLSIARAFVRNAPVLALDEATAALDSEVEAEVQRTIDELAEHRTVFCIAHRLSTLAKMDRIIVLSKGRIVESGPYAELIVKGGIFAGMAAKQGIRAADV
ncbi:MAG: ABC-type multidrug transport system fused ATPase/permease subunit [Candidatus Binatia bacterium]|jgi:ABC-type multidrug transport system fused ATPase/permease subunit